jgi:hypothetical protein
MARRSVTACVPALFVVVGVACTADYVDTSQSDSRQNTADVADASRAPSTAPESAEAKNKGPSSGPFFGTAYVEDHATSALPSDGDLWPSCWSDDDALYAANGDGKAFGGTFVDIAVSRVTGHPSEANLAGKTLATGDALGQIWTQGNFNRKPTGMLCVDGAIYLAVQDLGTDFLTAPAATIAVSNDHGVTWKWDRTKPMFSDYSMTTLMFLDFGKDGAHAIDGYVYVYAIDNNWRFTSKRLSPTRLWLARVPRNKILDRSSWSYFAGLDASGAPRFETDVAKRAPVLEDESKVYTKPFYSGGIRDMTVISQGGIVYDAPLDRYIYTSWTEFTYEFYEAPAPWGPWRKFLSRDYGNYPWSNALNGGYATTIPSKFISADGREMLVQSNTFVGGVKNYELSFRKLLVAPRGSSEADNARSETNLASRENGGVPIFRAGHAGATTILNDGSVTGSVDSWTDEEKTEDYWGVVWPRPYMLDTVSYTTGKMFPNGGWFTTLRLEVRRNGTWVSIPATSSPTYPLTADAGANATYVFTFDPISADGVRVIGMPGGATTFTSAAEISAQYR